ncbi:hypothetical protein [Terrisporobacter muris]|uniref:Uncharacterized protein n=1 Tax=Terrisporobacter muris TaxID=2963284 RepID=A0A9X2S2B2_9FIRM|nr:hypothetical protein [Terrisporobacter muris]MCR1821882.1 hypothetical protein [Terrisporobacter muris]
MDFIANLNTFGYKMISQGQTILMMLAVGAVVVGAILQITGGREGLDKAKKWYIGALVGFTIGMVAKPLLELFKQNMMF